MKNNINVSYLSYFLLVLAICFLTYQNHKISNKTENEVNFIKEVNDKSKVHTTIYYDQVIESLKKTNRTLYDSIKTYKNQIDYIAQFNYKKQYKIDTVYVDTVKNNEEVKTFTYLNNKCDTLNYELKIGSTTTPKWYTLDVSVSDKFTIINKKINDLNSTSIIPQNNGEITNVTLFNKKEKKSIFRNFALGPSISFGYDFAKKEPEFMVGVSLTYNLFGK